MERRVLLAVILSVVILVGFQALFPQPPDQAAQQQQQQQQQKPVQSSKTATAPNAAAPAASNPVPSIQPAAPLPAEAGAPQVPTRDLIVENADVRAVFTTRGGALKSWQLKKYHDDQQHSLEMLAGHAPADSPLPFTMATDDQALWAVLASAPFIVNESPGNGVWRAKFEYSDASGVRAEKTFEMSAASPYVIKVAASITRNG